MSIDAPGGFRDGYLALGANLGDRAQALAAAARELNAAGMRVVARSSIYETHAVTPDPQPDFLNAVLRIETALPAAALLQLCLSIERKLGRLRPAGGSPAPRTLDIDLLLLGSEIIHAPELTLPHPRLLQRAFVRVPLAEVARPGLRHPETGDALDAAPGDAGVRMHSAAGAW